MLNDEDFDLEDEDEEENLPEYLVWTDADGKEHLLKKEEDEEEEELSEEEWRSLPYPSELDFGMSGIMEMKAAYLLENYPTRYKKMIDDGTLEKYLLEEDDLYHEKLKTWTEILLEREGVPLEYDESLEYTREEWERKVNTAEFQAREYARDAICPSVYD